MPWSVSAWSSAIPFVQTNELRVVGGARIAPSGSLTVVSGAAIGWSSSATDPTVAADTSLTRSAAGYLGVTSGIRLPDGAAATPSYSFASSTGMGMWTTAGTLQFNINGTSILVIRTTSVDAQQTLRITSGTLGEAATRVSQGFFGTSGIDSTGPLLINSTNNTFGATALTVITGGIGFNTITAAASAPGAAGGKIEWRCGTNAGTIRIVAYGGTSATGVTVVDNVGGGVTGC